MQSIGCFIAGVPASKNRTGADRPELASWKAAIEEQVCALSAIDGMCRLVAEFVLPVDRFPDANPYGPDLDNLLKPLLDGLKSRVLPGGDDACIVELAASKRAAANGEQTGVKLEILNPRVVVKNA